MYRESDISDFLSLLKSGLWNTDAILPGTPNWTKIWQIANQQAVAGIVFDGICRLSGTHRPPQELKLRMIANSITIEQSNLKLQKVLREISQAYDAHGLSYLLLKGSAVAATYPNPLHRTCGDIDFYLAPDDCRKAQKLFFPNTKLDEREFRHYENRRHGIYIENHFRLSHSELNLYRDFETELLSDSIRLPHTKLIIDGYPVECPSPTFHVLFMLEHMAFHLPSGLGLRQLCDWARFLQFYSDQIDRGKVAHIIQKYHFERIAAIFTTICIDYLGMNPQYAIIPIERNQRTRRDTTYVMGIIMEGGNFGQHSNILHSSRKHLRLPKLLRKMVSVLVFCKDRRKYNLIAPSLWRKIVWSRLIHQK